MSDKQSMLNDLLKELTDSLKSVKDLTSEQLPLLVKEIIAKEKATIRYDMVVESIVTILFAALAIYLGTHAVPSVYPAEYHRAGEYRDMTGVQILQAVGSFVTGIVAINYASCLLTSIKNLIQINIAPRAHVVNIISRYLS